MQVKEWGVWGGIMLSKIRVVRVRAILTLTISTLLLFQFQNCAPPVPGGGLVLNSDREEIIETDLEPTPSPAPGATPAPTLPPTPTPTPAPVAAACPFAQPFFSSSSSDFSAYAQYAKPGCYVGNNQVDQACVRDTPTTSSQGAWAYSAGEAGSGAGTTCYENGQVSANDAPYAELWACGRYFSCQ
jgi:hypothetical protein